MSEGLFGDTIRDEVREIEEQIEEHFEEGLYFGLHGKRKREFSDGPSLGGRALRAIPRLPGFRWYAENVAPRHLRLEDVTVALPDLPEGLAGLRVGFLTDPHHDLGRPLALLERGVALLNEAAPDVIALGGDYVVKRAAGFDACTAVLGRLRAPLGVYAILGNHDYWAGGNLIAEKLAAAGLTVLRNRARRLLAPGGAPFWVAGLDDACRLRADLTIALAGVPRDEFRLLLAHEPEVADRVGGHRVDLQLSGHSHGGQVVLPFVGPPLLPRLGRRYIRGLARTPTHTVYTSRGLGGVPPYIRLNCPPEVTVLTLARR
ncbi:MAG TPA: metallophosphoesterase [Thermomicrobiales bacterium]|nr:metallophosphoesterase [Thermomicrobiales bacterium]